MGEEEEKNERKEKKRKMNGRVYLDPRGLRQTCRRYINVRTATM